MARKTGRNKKGKLYLSVGRKSSNNLAEYNRCRKADLPYVRKNSDSKLIKYVS